MKSIMKIAVMVICILAPLLGNAQNGRLKYANKQYANMSYYYASEGYEDVLDRGMDSSIVAKKIADSYHKINNVEKAYDWYGFLYRNNKLNQEEHLIYGNLLVAQGSEEQAINVHRAYVNAYGEDQGSRSLSQSIENQKEFKEGYDRFSLKNTEGNTTASEIGASYVSSTQLLLASSKKTDISINRIQAWTGGYYYNLYLTEVDNAGNFSKLRPLRSEANSNYNDGPACFDSTTSTVYFTRNNFLKGQKGTDSEGVMRLKIYSATLDGQKLKNVQELPFNSDAYSCGHPSISSDGKTLYFSSDKPGGFGGADIYSVQRNENGVWGESMNLGDIINTQSDELFPFQHPKQNILFFASEGHPGLGGFDIHVAKKNLKGEVKSIENLGAPINSTMDDVSFVNNANQTEGYVTTNRRGGAGLDDVYGFTQSSPILNSAILEGNTRDLLSGNLLENVSIELINEKGELVETIESLEDGSFEFQLTDIKDDFKLIAKKDGYIMNEQTIAFSEDKENYDEDLALMPIIDYYLAGNVRDKNTKELLEGVLVTITDLKKEDRLNDQLTGANGTFNSEGINYAYGDTVVYELVLSKEGYVPKTYVIRDLLSTSPEVYISGQIDVLLTPIETGIDIGKELVLNPIYFDLNSSILRVESKTELDRIVEFLNSNPNVSMELGAHTDCRAKDNYNLWLSKRRAKNSADYIKQRITNPTRITYEGYGETRPVNNCNCDSGTTNCTDEQHQLNRRTEFIVIGN